MMEMNKVIELSICLVLLAVVLTLSIVACVINPKRKDDIVISAFFTLMVILIISLFT